jgi:hypothetical protein
VKGSWSYLFTLQRRVETVEVTGLHIMVPPAGSRAMAEDFPPGSSSDFTGPDTAIDHFVIRNALLDVYGQDGGRLSFPIYELLLDGVVKGKALRYAVKMRNALPSGEISATGSFGPLDAQNLAATPVSGSFTFTSVRLADVGEIHGTLSSSGQFHGPLGAIEAQVTTHTPDFAVESGQPTPVDGSIQCTINSLQGDLAIHSIEAQTGRTTIRAVGTIEGTPNATNLDIEVDQGRAEDLLRMFVHDDVPVEGAVWIRAHAYLAPAEKGVGFLKRLHVKGTFDVPAERVTDKDTEKRLTDFSKRAQDRKSPEPQSPSRTNRDVLSSVHGPAQIEDGIASSTRIIFSVPGAQADMRGTFNFENKDVHLVGTLQMQSDISHAVTGFKSLLLKPLAPFFRKKNAGAVIPIAVLGGPGHYQVVQDFGHKR